MHLIIQREVPSLSEKSSLSLSFCFDIQGWYTLNGYPLHEDFEDQSYNSNTISSKKASKLLNPGSVMTCFLGVPQVDT